MYKKCLSKMCLHRKSIVEIEYLEEASRSNGQILRIGIFYICRLGSHGMNIHVMVNKSKTLNNQQFIIAFIPLTKIYTAFIWLQYTALVPIYIHTYIYIYILHTLYNSHGTHLTCDLFYNLNHSSISRKITFLHSSISS